MTNIEKEIELYELEDYSDFFIQSINKAIDTLENLLKVYAQGDILDNNLYDEDINYYLEIDYWDKDKFGTKAIEKGITLQSLDIDLLIFGKFEDMEEGVLASATQAFVNSYTGQPIVGIFYINKNINYLSNINLKEYLQSIFLHEFIHVLGFSDYIFERYFHILSYSYGTYYITSKKVIEVARKYFNCSNIYRIPLENYGGSGTVGSHWEARILLGEYMNGYLFPEEQVISEFTLALLEDLGYYKANYYTGGLMRYGKNKRCKFIEDDCINSSSQIDEFFENEFFDSIHFEYGIDNSCSSGRQSRTYNIF